MTSPTVPPSQTTLFPSVQHHGERNGTGPNAENPPCTCKTFPGRLKVAQSDLNVVLKSAVVTVQPLID